MKKAFCDVLKWIIALTFAGHFFAIGVLSGVEFYTTWKDIFHQVRTKIELMLTQGEK